MGCIFSGSPQTPPLPTLCATLHAFVLPEWPQRHLSSQHLLGYFLFLSPDSQMFFQLVSKWSSEELDQFYWEIWMPLELSWLWKDSTPPEKSFPGFLYLTKPEGTLREASLKIGDPCLQRPLLSHLRVPQVWYFVDICAIEAYRFDFSAMSQV